MISTKDLIKKRVLIIGSNGMLGQRLTEYFIKKNKFEIFCCSAEDESFYPDVEYKKINLAEKKDVKNLLRHFYPDVIINAAAYTNVDGCETNKELAWNINVLGVGYLAQFSRAFQSHLIHISSDYVFDGKNGPYTEKDIPNPISYYGRSKLASENVLKGSGSKYTIIRTNVLYGPAKFGRPDFVKWVVGSLKEGKEINIVTDQINNPTYLDDLVFAIGKIIELNKEGLYNIGGPEFLSRYDFTLRIARFFNLNKSLVNPILTGELKQPAPRPLKSGLITLKAETELSYKPHSIEESLLLMQKELNF